MRTVQVPDLDDLFSILTPFKRAVLAVSGGPDSMALMMLAARWVRAGHAPPGLTFDVATVDHGLRQASAHEAEWVAERAKEFGFSHTTLVWSGAKPDTGIQAQAREARYALLAAHASSHPPAAIVTAHTLDDQAETLLMRLGRGSGLDGLSGMAKVRPLLAGGSVQLARPLLGLSKAKLAAELKSMGVDWLNDPSNDRLEFERVRLRAAHVLQGELGLTNEKLALSASRLARARDALDRLTDERLDAIVNLHDGVFASLDRTAWEREPAEVRVRLLSRLLVAYGGDAKPAQLSQIEALETALANGKPMAQTLGGCIVSQGHNTLRLYREPGHQKLPEVSLAPGEEALWDWRFRIRYDVGDGVEVLPEQVSVRALGLPAYATLRSSLPANARPPARAAAGLPSIWAGPRLLAAPTLQGGSAFDGRFSAVFLGLDRLPR